MSDSLVIYETIAREASNNIEDYKAVGYTIYNRVKKGWYKSYRDACLANWQYSCWNDGTCQVERTPEQIKMAQQAWQYVIDHPNEFPSTHYHHVSIYPKWASSKQMLYVNRISEHKYYEEVR